VPISPDQVAPGRCYRTPGGQVWQVSDIADDERVCFRARRSPADPWLFEASVSRQTFASAVDHEVGSTVGARQQLSYPVASRQAKFRR
jgi:hypothetical protein